MALYGNVAKRPRTDQTQFGNHSEQFNNSYSEELRRKRPENDKVNHVLLFTIVNPVYPITTEVIHSICASNGAVQRIVIFRKNGVQAMVEFDSVEAAQRAKGNLQGADIYSGCCTLKIEYAKPAKLNVYKNDSDSWDYTAPVLNKSPEAGSGGANSRPAPLLQEPRFGAGPQPFRGQPGYGDHYEDPHYQNGPGGYPDSYGERYPAPAPVDRGYLLKGGGGREQMPPLVASGPRLGYGGPGGPGLMQSPANGAQSGGPGSVMMVYGLDPQKTNTDRLFNLFCLYGNVVRIKFLKTKEGCAMIQMGDSVAVERCITNLNHAPLMGSNLQLGYSKQAYLGDVQQPYNLPDGSPSYKDYMGNKNNRFINPKQASKNRIQPPSKVLHFFNTPPSLTEEELSNLFTEHICHTPINVSLFPMKGDRSSSGLVEFEELEHSLAALLVCNHLPIDHPGGKFPYLMKLCFSKRTRRPEKRTNEGGNNHTTKQEEEEEII